MADLANLAEATGSGLSPRSPNVAQQVIGSAVMAAVSSEDNVGSGAGAGAGQGNAPPGPKPEPTPLEQFIMESNISKVRKILEKLHANDRAGIRGMLHPAVSWTNRRGGTREGIDAMMAKLGGLQVIYPDTQIESTNFSAMDLHTVNYDSVMTLAPKKVFRNRSEICFDDAGQIVRIDNSKPLDADAEREQTGTGTEKFPDLVPIVDGRRQVY